MTSPNWITVFLFVLPPLYGVQAAMSTFTAPLGNIYDSGGATNNYGNNEVVDYEIDCGISKIVLMVFTQFSFQNSVPCKDYISIYQDSEEGAVLYSGCSYSTTSYAYNFISQSSKAYIKYVTNAYTTAAGFTLNYR